MLLKKKMKFLRFISHRHTMELSFIQYSHSSEYIYTQCNVCVCVCLWRRYTFFFIFIYSQKSFFVQRVCVDDIYPFACFFGATRHQLRSRESVSKLSLSLCAGWQQNSFWKVALENRVSPFDSSQTKHTRVIFFFLLNWQFLDFNFSFFSLYKYFLLYR